MPQSSRPRQDDKDRSAKAQEQELKRARGAISCAECRRLKLKCDKTVPCSSCKRRGCASICPNGSLTTGQGTRFILADTDRLHRKIAEMSDRIRQLEDGLAILQSSVSRDLHPLLSQDLLKIKSGLELHSASNFSYSENTERTDDGDDDGESKYIDAFGTLALRDDGAATFYGHSAGSESLLLNEPTSPTSISSPTSPILPAAVTRLASSFPASPSDLSSLHQIHAHLPPWPRAAQLCDLYLEQAPWFFGAVARAQLLDELLPLFYPEAAAVSTGAAGTPAAFGLLPARGAVSAHDLALLFVIFCFGALTDSTLPPAPFNQEAETYFQLTRASLALEPVLDRPPSVATVQTLSLMGIYQGLVAEEHSIESTWALMGLSSKLAQSIGLHRDCARFQLSTAEVQKRRGLFWELFITDCWQALATGRLPTFSLQFVDTELAGDPDQTLEEDGSVQPSFPAWKARWGKECVSPIVMGTLTSQAPRYAVILELDRRIRDMPLPKYAQGAAPRGAGLAQTMSHYMPINYLHLTLLYVHRCFFAQALSQHPTDPMRSQYAPSFLAGYRSACALLSTVREQFMLFPVQIARFWVLWTHAFSSSVMLASVVTHGGTTKTAQAALGELRLACDLFERAATHGGRAVKFLPILRRLQDKAQQAHFKGLQPLRHDIFTPRNAQSDAPDELSIFSGRTRTVATKAHKPRARSESRRRVSPGTSSSSSGGSAAPTPPDSAGSGSGAGAGSSPGAGAEVFPMVEPAARARVHPGLVDEMRAWQGQLDAQIAYCREGAGVEMETPFAYQAASGEGWYAEPEQEGVSPGQQQQLQHRQQEHPQQEHQQRHQQQHQQQHRQQQQHQQHQYQQQEYLQALQPHPSHSMQAQAPPVRVHPVQAQHPVQTSQPIHAAIHATTESQAHSLPVYGAVDPGPPADASYHPYAAPPPPAAHEYHAEYEYEYTHAPAHHANANVHSELWAVPPQAQESALLYGTSPEFQQLVEEQYGLKHGHGQQMQMQMMPPPPPPPSVLPVYTGGYSLQESWTSFMQNELPTPVQSSHGRR